MNLKYQVSDIGDLAQLITNENILYKHKGAIGIRKLLCEKFEETSEYFIKMGLTAHFVMFMEQDEYLQLKLEAAWTLANILNGNSEQCSVLVGYNVIPMFVEIVKHDILSIT